MSILSGAGRLIGGVLVEIDDPALGVQEAALRVKYVFEDKLGIIWPEEMPKLSYALAPNTVGETRFIAVYGLGAASPICADMYKGQGHAGYIALLDRVAAAAERILKPSPGVEPEPVEGANAYPGVWEKPAEQPAERPAEFYQT